MLKIILHLTFIFKNSFIFYVYILFNGAEIKIFIFWISSFSFICILIIKSQEFNRILKPTIKAIK
jgi:hypothetical protein